MPLAVAVGIELPDSLVTHIAVHVIQITECL